LFHLSLILVSFSKLIPFQGKVFSKEMSFAKLLHRQLKEKREIIFCTTPTTTTTLS